MKKWNPAGRARGTIYSPPSPKDGYGETSAVWSRFHLAEVRLRLPPWVKPLVPGGGGWNSLLGGLIFFSLLTGCATHQPTTHQPTTHQPKRDTIVLLADPDGKVGTITVTTSGGSQVVEKPGYAIEIEDPNKAPIASKPVSESEINQIFGSALSALPDSPNRFLQFILYFEHDTTKLTQESKGLFPEVLKTIKNRKPNEIYVVGHTDLVGTESYNIELSSKRAKYIKDLFVSNGVKPGTFYVSYYGKSRPLVPTQNEVPEPRNRRVEVIVR